MPDVNVIEIAYTVTLERARRRPHAAIAFTLTLLFFASSLIIMLFGQSTLDVLPAKVPSVTWRVLHSLGAIAVLAGMSGVFEWFLRLEVPQYSVPALRLAWAWRGLEKHQRRTLPYGHLALLMSAFIGVFGNADSFGCVIEVSALSALVGLYVLSPSVLHLQPGSKLLKKMRIELVRLLLVNLMSGVGCAVAVTFGNAAMVLPVLLSVGLLIFVGTPRHMYGRFTLSSQTDLLSLLAVRLLPGLVFLLSGALLTILWHALDLTRWIDPSYGMAIQIGCMIVVMGESNARRLALLQRADLYEQSWWRRLLLLVPLEKQWLQIAGQAFVIIAGGISAVLLCMGALLILASHISPVVVIMLSIVRFIILSIVFIAGLIAITGPYVDLCSAPLISTVDDHLRRAQASEAIAHGNGKSSGLGGTPR